MKERYFTNINIHTKANNMLNDLKSLKRKHNFKFKPEKSTLLIIDMQDYFIKNTSHAYIPSTDAIIPGLKDLIMEYYKKNLNVVFTKHINSPANEAMLKKWWKDTIKNDNPLSRITPRLDTSKGIKVTKSQYDAFYRTNLEKILNENGTNQIVICGVMTHLCCETTARSAFVHGFEIIFPIDGTVTYNENFHRATLLNLSHGFAIPVLIDELLDILRKE